MGFQVPKHHNKRGWKVLHVSYKGGKRVYRGVSLEEYVSFGLRLDMTQEEARATLKPFNSKEELARHEKRQNEIVDRLKSERLTDELYLPSDLLTEFEESKLDLTRPKIKSYWNRARQILAEVRLEPEDWDDNVHQFYNAFTKRQMSPSYVRQVFPLLNAWGKFIAKRRKCFFVPIPPMRGGNYKKVAEAYFNKTQTAGNKESDPLTPELLENKRTEFIPENYRWLLLSVWFGLRPIEVDLLRSP